jgi:tetratricopeptide (TPR) repeat protein
MKLHNLIVIICLLLISACGFSEKEARVLLNQAISEWDNGEIKKSLALFDRISSEYLDTKAATEALKEKKQLLAKYQQKYSPKKSLAQNKGVLSKLIITGVGEYHKKNNVYPDALSAIKISLKNSEKYFPLCLYSKAIMNYGYKLDCTEADTAYLADREMAEKEARTLLNKAINQWQTGRTKEALITFELILEKYSGTKVAYESVSKKNYFIKQLKDKGRNISKIYFVDDFPKVSTPHEN